ncbi:MAG TPA: glycosyltransferase [Candidatus Dormibacteraeota bacterium]|jgi:cellulose synthase/poly-beta-1,6-N-acetylglucosamine synthase-like glycosyltransferase
MAASAWAAAWLAAHIEPTPSAMPPWYAIALLLAAGLTGIGYLFRQIHWPARLFLASLSLTSGTYLAVVLKVTFAGGLPLLGVLLSSVLLVLELVAILLTMVFAFEMADVLGRDTTEPEPGPGSSEYRPRVCLQVPAYNEPPELVRQTLEALARLDYPNYLVQVVVNNTTDPALWRPVQDMCTELGGQFQFIHLPRWPGFKAGALNEATRLLDPDVEVVAIIDADYLVAADFLSACIPFLADSNVAFVQTPQHYREWRDSPYLRGLFHAYRYFFDVTMVSRARSNAIIFGGTMGLIRLSALKEIGGWAEWCITEDAEASLLILARGWKAVYLNRPFGEGLMPMDFDGLRRQRYRWAFGGVQILRRHLGLLLGILPSRLTPAQRYYYLVGGLGWFGDLVGAGLGLFLLLASPLIVFGHVLLLRQLTGAVLVLPLLLLVSGLIRLGWALKLATGARWRDVPFAVMVMLALTLTVAQACARGLYQARGVFLRTPKSKSPSRLWRALVGTWLESSLAVASLAMLPAVVVLGPRPLGPVLGVLLGWQVIAWGSASGASLLSQGIKLTPIRLVFRRSPQNRGGRSRPWAVSGRALALGPALAIAAFIVLVPAAVTGRDDDKVIAKALNQTGLGALPALASGPSPTPSGSLSPIPKPSPSGGGGFLKGPTGPVPSGSTSSTPASSSSASPSPGPTTQPSPTATPTATAAPTPTPRPTGAPSPVPSPTAHPTPSPGPR